MGMIVHRETIIRLYLKNWVLEYDINNFLALPETFPINGIDCSGHCWETGVSKFKLVKIFSFPFSLCSNFVF